MSTDRVSAHYDDAYFRRQVDIGAFGGWANRSKFERHVRPDDAVLDFGCGGGFLLKGLECARRMGVEINPAAAKVARENGVEVFGSLDDVPDESADVVISNHALEHALRPLDELRAMRRKVRPGGKVVIVVPCESILANYVPGDVNNHLYTWSPMNLGNALNEAGFKVLESKVYLHKWPPKWRKFVGVYKRNRALFDLLSRLTALVRWKSFQVRAVAQRVD